jgi:hypothetical protein
VDGRDLLVFFLITCFAAVSGEEVEAALTGPVEGPWLGKFWLLESATGFVPSNFEAALIPRKSVTSNNPANTAVM